jgi:hypothetical protein
MLRAPYAQRRARLEQLFTEHHLAAPWTLGPETNDLATAQERLASWTEVPGVEGLVIRGSTQPYSRGARALYNVRRRHTTEAVIGAITGTVRRPQTLVLGRLDHTGCCGPSAPRPAHARAAARRSGRSWRMIGTTGRGIRTRFSPGSADMVLDGEHQEPALADHAGPLDMVAALRERGDREGIVMRRDVGWGISSDRDPNWD